MEKEDFSEYTCFICQEILNNPVKITKCNHVFCNECLNNAISAQSEENKKENKIFTCPLCRVKFNKKDKIKYSSLEKKMKSIKRKCDCGKEINILEYNKHCEMCTYVNENIKKIVRDNVVKDVKEEVNRVTFKCSICSEKNLDRKGVIKHVEKCHPSSVGVCPICITQPWGDPNYTTFLLGHLKKRHMFDYDTTVDYNSEEDEVLRRVLLESMNDK